MSDNKRTGDPGSVSSGTLRNEDLYPAFMDALTELDPVRAVEIDEGFKEDVCDAALRGDTEAEVEEIVTEAIESLRVALDECAPDGYYFGAHPGDGADFGFWREEDDEDDYDNVEDR